MVKVNVKDAESPAYKEYMGLFKSEYVPHFVLIDSNKKVLNEHTGGLDVKGLVQFTGK